jgi:type IV secretion/conjugal transfer VirB4 family ATPase
MLRDWWLPVAPETTVEDMLPFAAVIDDELLQLKSGHVSMVYSVTGRDYTGLSESEQKQLHGARSQFVRFLEPNISVTVFSKRMAEDDDVMLNPLHPNEIADGIDKCWNKQFETSYRTRHFLVVTTATGQMINSLADAADGDTKKDRQIINIREAAQKVDSLLSMYRPRRLRGADLLSFWASYINGREVRQSRNQDFLAGMAGANILFPTGKKYQIFEGSKNRFAAWVGIKAFENDSTDRIIEELLRQKIEFTLYQNWRALPLGATHRMIADKERMARSWAASGVVALAEIDEATARIEAGDLTFCRYILALQIFGSNELEIEANVEKLEAVIEHYGFRAVRETSNIELLFWSALPGNDHLAVRRRELTNDNVADFASFATIGEGFSTCSWGDTYVTKLLTNANTEYRFTWHEDDKPQAPGHTLIFGPTGGGKTALLSFLFSQSLKFDNLKIITFDKLHGLEVFTKLHGGTYSDFGNDIETNPFQMPDTPQNRNFLKELVKNLVAGSDIDEEVINMAIRDNYTLLKKEERNLTNLFGSFGLDARGTMARALRPYVGDGDHAGFFNGKRDSLNFETSSITTFGMDTLFDNPKMLAQMALYIFFRIREMASPGKGKVPVPHLIFVDELVKYLEDPTFAKKGIREIVLEHRKLEGVFVGAMQDPSYFVKNPEAEGLLGSIVNFIFLPDGKADEEILMEKCGLTKEEAAWVKHYSGGERKALLKRRSGESVILNTDLSGLGKYLNVFDSSSAAVGRLKSMIDDGIDFKKEFLK